MGIEIETLKSEYERAACLQNRWHSIQTETHTTYRLQMFICSAAVLDLQSN